MGKVFIRFVIGGVISFAVKIVATYVATEVFHLWYFYSYLSSLVLLIIVNYLVNTYYIFKVRGDFLRTFAKYLGSILLFYLADAALVKVLTDWLLVNYLVSIVVSTSVGFAAKFFVYHFFLFVRKDEKRKMWPFGVAGADAADGAPPSRTRLRSLVIGLALAALAGGAVLGYLAVERRRTVQVPILMYHRIADGGRSVWWVSPADFEMHLQSLREQGFRSVLPPDLAAHRRWGRPLPRKPVIITLDDGYLNSMQNAEPLLKKWGFTAVCYLITGRVGETPQTRQVFEDTPVLIWPEVRAMQRRGAIAFGGHTRDHANLAATAEPFGEVRACFDDLRRHGIRPAGFCYPSGQYRKSTMAEVARAGFTSAVTCREAIAELGGGADLLELPRIGVLGGLHRYHAEAANTADGLAAFRIWKEGRAMRIIPRLVWKHSTGAGDGWLPEAEVSAEPTLLSFPHPVSSAPAGIEIWDLFRVLRLASLPLS